jgi:hypothetical protein
MGINAIPMYWGEKQTDDFKRLVVKGYADTVLGFNEYVTSPSLLSGSLVAHYSIGQA